MSTRNERLDEEIAFHIEQQTTRNIRAGMSPDDARRAALRQFGGVDQAREYARDEFRGAWLADLWRDLRIGLRSLRRVPAFSITAVATFALGIGTAAAMFSVFDGVLLRPLPYPDADRLVRVYQLGPTGQRGNVSEPNFNDWRDGTRVFAAMAETAGAGQSPIVFDGVPRLARMTLVSAAFFDVMGVTPRLGRTFTDAERRPGGPRVAIVSASFWNAAHGDVAPSGEIVRSGSDTYEIVGVMPPGFDYPARTAIWLPREMEPPQTSRTAHNFQVIARLRDGVTLERAQVELSTLSRALKARHGDETWMHDAAGVPLREVVTATSKPTLRLLFAASLLLLVVACTNVSNLLVARMAARRAEFAVQLSMGATTGRLGRQLLAETMLLAGAGTLVGILVATVAVKLFVATAPASVPRLEAVSVSVPAISFAVGVSMLAAVCLSLYAAWSTRTLPLREALTEHARASAGGRSHLHLREGLIVAQVALTLVLLAGAALLARSLQAVHGVSPGYSLDDALLLDVTLPDGDRETGPARYAAVHETLLTRLRHLPGVTRVGLVSDFPLGGGNAPNGMFIEMTRPDEITRPEQFRVADPALKARAGSAEFRLVAGDYFTAMAIPVLKGRAITDADTPATTHVAVISRTLAEAQWPGRDPIGRWIQFGNMDGDLRGIQIVGVVGDVREGSLEAPPRPIFYVSALQRPAAASQATFIVRGAAPETLAESARRIVHDVNPEVPVTIRTVSETRDTVLAARRFALWLVGAFAASALVLAALGVYGLVAFMVSQRTREMGIRMALGAHPRSLVWLVVNRGAKLAAVGALLGLAVSRVAGSLLDGMLFGVTSGDLATLAATTLATFVIATMASYAPAQRILRQSPSHTLRDA